MEADLSEAEQRMAALAINLAQAFTPIGAANLLAGSAFGVLTQTFGSDAARRYFSELAGEIEPEGLQ